MNQKASLREVPQFVSEVLTANNRDPDNVEEVPEQREPDQVDLHLPSRPNIAICSSITRIQIESDR